MTYVTDTRAAIVDAMRDQARQHDAAGRPFVAAVHRECADELEASTRAGANVAGVWLGPDGDVKRLVPARRGAERVLRAVAVWGGMAALRARMNARLPMSSCQFDREPTRSEILDDRDHWRRRATDLQLAFGVTKLVLNGEIEERERERAERRKWELRLRWRAVHRLEAGEIIGDRLQDRAGTLRLLDCWLCDELPGYPLRARACRHNLLCRDWHDEPICGPRGVLP